MLALASTCQEYANGLAREACRAKALAMPAERAYEDMLNYMLNYIRKGSYACVVESQSRRAIHAHHVLYVAFSRVRYRERSRVLWE